MKLGLPIGITAHTGGCVPTDGQCIRSTLSGRIVYGVQGIHLRKTPTGGGACVGSEIGYGSGGDQAVSG